MSGLSLALGPILGGALVDGFGWRSIFWINVPIVAAAMVCTALFVPESRAARARRFDPVGQTLVILVLGSVVYAIIESRWLGWTSPIILSLLGVGIGVLGLLSTGRWALDTARRAATLFEEVDRGADLRTAPSARTT
jgi:MFS family permease